MWLIILSDQLSIVALVGLYPTNKLIERRLLSRRLAPLTLRCHAVLAVVSHGYPPPRDRYLRVTHPSATDRLLPVRLACVKHAASVRSEPGSNSQVHPAHPATRKTPGQTKQTDPKLETLNASTKPTRGRRRKAISKTLLLRSVAKMRSAALKSSHQDHKPKSNPAQTSIKTATRRTASCASPHKIQPQGSAASVSLPFHNTIVQRTKPGPTGPAPHRGPHPLNQASNEQPQDTGLAALRGGGGSGAWPNRVNPRVHAQS